MSKFHGQWTVVNPGRPPTPIGGDGIAPWIRVEAWLTASIVKMLEAKGITHHVRRDGFRQPNGIEVFMDRISFPGGDPRQLQSLFNGWAPTRE